MTVVIFFNDTATTEIYTLSLHDALPIFDTPSVVGLIAGALTSTPGLAVAIDSTNSPLASIAYGIAYPDRKSTRLNSSHANISYAVFCLKKKSRSRRPL